MSRSASPTRHKRASARLYREPKHPVEPRVGKTLRKSRRPSRIAKHGMQHSSSQLHDEPRTGHGVTSALKKTGKAVGHAAHAVAHGVAVGAKTVKHGVEKGAHAANAVVTTVKKEAKRAVGAVTSGTTHLASAATHTVGKLTPKVGGLNLEKTESTGSLQSALVPVWKLDRDRDLMHNYEGTFNLVLRGNTPLAVAASQPSAWDVGASPGSILIATYKLSRPDAFDNDPNSTSVPFMYLQGFYSRAQKDRLFAKALASASPTELEMLRGVGHTALCFILQRLLQLQLLQSHSLVVLEASGHTIATATASSTTRFDPGLSKYYLSLGFRFYNPPSKLFESLGRAFAYEADQVREYEPLKSWQDLLDSKSILGIPFAGSVDEILNVCTLKNKLNKLDPALMKTPGDTMTKDGGAGWEKFFEWLIIDLGVRGVGSAIAEAAAHSSRASSVKIPCSDAEGAIRDYVYVVGNYEKFGGRGCYTKLPREIRMLHEEYKNRLLSLSSVQRVMSKRSLSYYLTRPSQVWLPCAFSYTAAIDYDTVVSRYADYYRGPFCWDYLPVEIQQAHRTFVNQIYQTYQCLRAKAQNPLTAPQSCQMYAGPGPTNVYQPAPTNVYQTVPTNVYQPTYQPVSTGVYQPTYQPVSTGVYQPGSSAGANEINACTIDKWQALVASNPKSKQLSLNKCEPTEDGSSWLESTGARAQIYLPKDIRGKNIADAAIARFEKGACLARSAHAPNTELAYGANEAYMRDVHLTPAQMHECQVDPFIMADWKQAQLPRKFFSLGESDASKRAYKACARKYSDVNTLFGRCNPESKTMLDTVEPDWIKMQLTLSNMSSLFQVYKTLPWTTQEEMTIVSPAENFAVLFSSTDEAKQLWIKGTKYSIAELLGTGHGPQLTILPPVATFVFRLTPRQYHRFHNPLTGRLIGLVALGHRHLSVQPSLLQNSRTNVLTENVRLILFIQTAYFGTVAVVIVGATCVFSIVLTHPVPAIQAQLQATVEKARHTQNFGQLQTFNEPILLRKRTQLGYFRYGSTLLLLLPNQPSVLLSSHLQLASQKALETEILVGQPIACSTVPLTTPQSASFSSLTAAAAPLTSADFSLCQM